jgi:hypothetical protein
MSALGKGAWDVDADAPIPPEREAEVFEEIASDAPAHMFAGQIPTVPPRRNATHLSVFHAGVRYRLRADVTERVADVKARLAPALTKAPRPAGARSEVEPVESPDDLLLFFAGAPLRDDETLEAQRVPPGCRCLAALEKRLREPGAKPHHSDAYWN